MPINQFFQSYWIDILVFIVFVISVVATGLIKSRKEKTSEDYFLAGRGLTWWLIGFSLIAANISTEQFVGMSGNAASHVGLAIASYEWMAAITLVVVAFGFLPYFLRAGIFTMPEFLEVRYNGAARTLMAIATLFIYMLLLGSVTYSGALTIRTLAGNMGYNVSLLTGSLIIGIIAMLYVTAGGLKACAWADLIQGSALIIGGAVILYFALNKLGLATEASTIRDISTGAVDTVKLLPEQGALTRFWELNKVRMNMFLPANDTILPWTALLLGLWIPNFYYWGLNQYITQRTLGSASLAQGQRGIVFSAFLKLLIPFVIVIPGIIAFNLYSGDMKTEAVSDNAKVMSKYVKVNSSTRLVHVDSVMTGLMPADSILSHVQPGHFIIALYDKEEDVKQLRTFHPNFLPMTKSEFSGISGAKNALFVSEDKSWQNVFPELASEVSAYNNQVRTQFSESKDKTISEKFIAYKYDTALAQLLGKVLPHGKGFLGFVLAALLGAVVSSLAAMLNASSTIFAMDVYKKHMSPGASQKSIVGVGRICVFLFSVIAIVLAPQLGNPKISNSIFTIIQEGQGFISPGILAVFVFGLLVRKAPPISGVIGMITNIVAYGLLKLTLPQVQFLNRMAICFGLCIAVMGIVTLIRPLQKPVEFKAKTSLDLKSSRGAKLAGFVVIGLTLVLYFLFSPAGLIR